MVATAASLLVAAAVLSDPPAWAAAFLAIVDRIGDFTIGEIETIRRQDWKLPTELGGAMRLSLATFRACPSRLLRSMLKLARLNRWAMATALPERMRSHNSVGITRHAIASVPAWEPFAEPLAAS